MKLQPGDRVRITADVLEMNVDIFGRDPEATWFRATKDSIWVVIGPEEMRFWAHLFDHDDTCPIRLEVATPSSVSGRSEYPQVGDTVFVNVKLLEKI